MAVVLVIALIYGSLLPFSFEWSKAVSQSGGSIDAIINALTSPAWIANQPGESALGFSRSLIDHVFNLLLYVPLGLVLRMALRPRRWGWLLDCSIVVVVGFVMSWTLESLQSLMPMRVASLNDVVCNTGGALLGSIVAVPAWFAIKHVAFLLYCKFAYWSHLTQQLMSRPIVAMLIAVLNAVIIGMWYVGEVRRSEEAEASLLPFERAYRESYDLGALLLGEAMLVYAGIGCLLLLLAFTGARRVAMNWIVLGVVGLAFLAELSRVLTYNVSPDITGVLLAFAAASIMTVTVYSFSHAIRRMERRHQRKAYEGPERRRQPHDYL